MYPIEYYLDRLTFQSDVAVCSKSVGLDASVIRALTGLRARDFERLVAATQPGAGHGRPPRLRHRHRVPGVLTALRTNMTEQATIQLPGGATTLTDAAYKPFPGATTPPKNDPAALKAHMKPRARIEHILARMKDRQIPRQYRRRENAINHAVRAVDYLYNLRFDRLAGLRINS